MNPASPMLTTFARASTAIAPSQEPCASRPQADEFHGPHHQNRNNEDDQRGGRRQALDCCANARLEARQIDQRDEPRHQSGQTAPQPRLKQKDEREQNPERFEQAAHYCNCLVVMPQTFRF